MNGYSIVKVNERDYEIYKDEKLIDSEESLEAAIHLIETLIKEEKEDEA